ncbi:hypothetical protein F441_20911, partial [Phytophthora nicotianae CJ01A1]
MSKVDMRGRKIAIESVQEHAVDHNCPVQIRLMAWRTAGSIGWSSVQSLQVGMIAAAT